MQKRRMLMLSVPLGKAERVVQLANEAGATGATIMPCREMLSQPGAFQLEPQRDWVIIVINAEMQAQIEENIQKMNESLENVSTGQVTFAVRDTEFNENSIIRLWQNGQGS